MDGPGHYFRRIKTVAREHPVRDRAVRQRQLHADAAEEQHPQDARCCATASTRARMPRTIASTTTSAACNPSSPARRRTTAGMFETNLRDERYLPFENSGVISEWQLELPANPSKGDPQQFDYDTISDVILHIRYTAREGGALLRKGAIETIKELIDAAQASGSVRLFSVRHEFPTEWARFQSQTPAANQRFELALKLHRRALPVLEPGTPEERRAGGHPGAQQQEPRFPAASTSSRSWRRRTRTARPWLPGRTRSSRIQRWGTCWSAGSPAARTASSRRPSRSSEIKLFFEDRALVRRVARRDVEQRRGVERRDPSLENRAHGRLTRFAFTPDSSGSRLALQHVVGFGEADGAGAVPAVKSVLVAAVDVAVDRGYASPR